MHAVIAIGSFATNCSLAVVEVECFWSAKHNHTYRVPRAVNRWPRRRVVHRRCSRAQLFVRKRELTNVPRCMEGRALWVVVVDGWETGVTERRRVRNDEKLLILSSLARLITQPPPSFSSPSSKTRFSRCVFVHFPLIDLVYTG